jgi:hypothetical protein
MPSWSSGSDLTSEFSATCRTTALVTLAHTGQRCRSVAWGRGERSRTDTIRVKVRSGDHPNTGLGVAQITGAHSDEGTRLAG